MTLNKNEREFNADPAFPHVFEARAAAAQPSRPATPPSHASRYVVSRAIYWLADAADALFPTAASRLPRDSIEYLAGFRGAAVSMARALREAPTGQPTSTTVAVVLGSAVAGGLVGWATAHLRRTMPDECINELESMLVGAMPLFVVKAIHVLCERAVARSKST